jgi:DNA polymerase III epsilon subunit-like protein
MKYLFIDTETGGLNPEFHSLLTVSFHLVDNLEHVPSNSVHVKFGPQDGYYRVSPEALAVNNINLVHHTQEALPYVTAHMLLRDWLARRFSEQADSQKFMPVGWNLPFDLSFLYHQFLPKREWEQYVSYHSIDVMTIAEFFVLTGKLPKEVTRLTKAAQHFNIPIEGAHNADYDNYLCRRVLQEMMKLC